MFARTGFVRLLFSAAILALSCRVSARAVDDDRSQLIATAVETNSYSPFYSVREGLNTDLVLMNTTQDPVSVDVYVRTPRGEEASLGRHIVAGASHTELSLKELLKGLSSAFEEGSVRLNYISPKDSLPSWAVLRSADASRELKLQVPAQSGGSSLLSFWDRPGVDYYLLNTSPSAVNYTLAAKEQRAHGVILPGERRLVPVRGAQGWIRISHDGRPGDLIGLGLDRSSLTSYLVTTLEEAGNGPVFESVGLAEASTAVSVWNLAERSQTVRLEFLGQASGAMLAAESAVVGPGDIRTFRVPQGLQSRQRLRARLSGDHARLLVGGGASFFSAHEAQEHRGGTYPLLDPERYEVTTSFVNLGSGEASLLLQAFWRGGTYSYGPVRVPPAGAKVVRIDDLTGEKPDILLRTFDTKHPNGILKWIVQGREASIIARTEARPREGSPAFGFNCFGCCYQTPKGRVDPGSVTFLPGDTALFEADVLYDTCSGPMGPYPPDDITSLTVPAPFTWDAVHAGASGPKRATLSYAGHAEKIRVLHCEVSEAAVGGTGAADTCRFWIIGYNPNKTCSGQTAFCSSCFGCCESFYNYNVCRGVDPHYADAERQACRGLCITDKRC